MREEIRNAVWRWFLKRGLDPRQPENREMFEKAREAMLEKFEDSDDEGDEGGSLQQVLIAQDVSVDRLVRNALDQTMDREVDRFVENIIMFDLFEQAISNGKKRTSKQNEELDEEVDLSDLDIDNLKL